MDTSCQSICGLVGHVNGIIFGLETGDAAHGAKDFLLHDLHILVDAGEDCGLDEVANVAKSLAANLDFGAVFLASLNVAECVLVNKRY